MSEKYTVYFYHGTQNDFEIPRKSKLQTLFDECCHYLHIEESDYFSLYATDTKGKVTWLNLERSIRKQLVGTARDNIHFGVKYYHMDPTQLYSEETRLCFVHQVIDDIRDKQYPLNENQLNLITALYIQSELGDYEEGNNVPGYTKEFFLFGHQSPDSEDEIVNQHKANEGKPPAQCENEILCMAREQALYGVHTHSGALQEGKEQHPARIGIHARGIRIWVDDSEQMFDLPWNKVTKLETKRRKFIVRVKGKLPGKRDSSDLLGHEEGEVPDPTEPQQAEASKEPDEMQDLEPSTQEPSLEPNQETAPSVQPPAGDPEIEPTAPGPDPDEPIPKPDDTVSKQKQKEQITAFKFLITDRTYVKTIWRLAAEHHYFFNRVPEKPPRFRFMRIGSSKFRYTSGRTFRQTQKEFSEKKFDPIDPDLRVRMSQRRRRHSGQRDETEDSAYPMYVKAKDSFRRRKEEVEETGEKREVTNEMVEKPVWVPTPGSAEADMQKEVTDKFLEGELQKETGRQEGEAIPPPESVEISPVANGDGEMPNYPPPPGAIEKKESAPEVIKELLGTANANGDDNAVVSVEQ